MIVEALMQLVFNLFALLTTPIAIPSMPESVHTYLTYALGFLSQGAGILACYVDLGYLIVLLGVVLAVDAGILVYKLVMWIIRKIPMLGIQ